MLKYFPIGKVILHHALAPYLISLSSKHLAEPPITHILVIYLPVSVPSNDDLNSMTQTHLYESVHDSLIHNSSKLNPNSINRKMGNLVYSYSGTLLHNKKERHADTHHQEQRKLLPLK